MTTPTYTWDDSLYNTNLATAYNENSGSSALEDLFGKSTVDQNDIAGWFDSMGTNSLEHYNSWGADYGVQSGYTPYDGGTIELPSTSTYTPVTTDYNPPSVSTSYQPFESSFNEALQLPDTIDSYYANAINSQRATGDQITSILNAIGNQRAGSGIMGGTEHDNLTANYLTELTKLLNDNKTQLVSEAAQLKSNAIMQLPSLALGGWTAANNAENINSQNEQFATSLQGTNDRFNTELDVMDQQFWAQQAANMINMGY